MQNWSNTHFYKFIRKDLDGSRRGLYYVLARCETAGGGTMRAVKFLFLITMPKVLNQIVGFCQRITKSPGFDNAILGIIILNAAVVGLETSPRFVEQFGGLFHAFNQLVLLIFIVEAALKIMAEAPRVERYFCHGWNVFDFSIVVVSLLPMGGQFATTARLVRVLRVTRLISAVPQLRLIIATLLRSLPSMVHIVLLLGVLFYIYGIMGYYLFHQVVPEQWGSFGSSLLTLFGVVTLETWVDTMGALLPTHPFAWMYFVSFIVVGTFMFVNLFVAVVINNLGEAQKEALQDLGPAVTKHELLQELRETKEALVRLEAKLEKQDR